MKKYIRPGLISLVAVMLVFASWQYCRERQLSNMVGQMLLVGFRGATPDEESVRDLSADIRTGKIGGVILFSVDVERGQAAGLEGVSLRAWNKSRNIIDISQVKKLNEYLSSAALDAGRPPLFISIDQEGGRVVRLTPNHGFNVEIPSAKEMSKLSIDDIGLMYEKLGTALKDLGFNVNFAPCVDVDVNPKSPAIGAIGRAFSDNPARIAKYGSLAADGLLRAGILPSFKHFPGHGSANTDTHEGIVDVTDTWQSYELTPYSNVPEFSMIMVAHVVNKKLDSDYPASLSKKTIDGLLRGKLGFQGVVISDDLQMGAIYKNYGLSETLRLAILAGNDILLLGNNLQYTENLGRIAHKNIIKMVHSGEIPRSRIKESYDRIIYVKERIK